MSGDNDFHDRAGKDFLEQQLCELACANAEIRVFLKDYAQCKDFPAEELFLRMVACSYFEPPSTVQYWAPKYVRQGMQGSVGNSKKITFSQGLDQFRIFLQKGETGCARFCIISSDDDDHGFRSKAFPFRTKLFMTVQQLARKYNTPLSALLRTVASEWQFHGDPVGDSNKRGDYTRGQRKRRPLTVASAVDASREQSIADGGQSMELQWLAIAPSYKVLIYTYVWRPHIRPPDPIIARIYVSVIDRQGARNVLVILEGWDHSNGSLSTYKIARVSGPGDYSRIPSSNTQEIHLYIYAALKQLLEDSSSFVDSAYDQVAELTYSGRKSPRTEQLSFLLHFRDCCGLSANALTHAASLVQELSTKVAFDASPGHKALKTWFDKASQDIEFLRLKVLDIEKQILATRDMIKDQLDLRNGRRTGLIGLLAAIYVPFAFMSSLFGMNIADPIWGSIVPAVSNGSDEANSTPRPGSSTAKLEDQTQAIVSAISSSGSYLWSFKMYWMITTPVTFTTILLPLIAGPTIRTVTRTSYNNRAYARPMLIVLGLVGEIALATLIPGLPYVVIVGTVYGVLAAVMLFWSSHTGRNQRLWAVFSAFVSYPLVYDANIELFGSRIFGFGLTGVLPLAYLVFTVYRLEIRRHLVPKFPTPLRTSVETTVRVWHRFNPTTRRWMVRACYYGLAWCMLSMTGIWTDFIIFFGIYGVNRLIRSSKSGEYLIWWLLYAGVYCLSISLGYWIEELLTAFLPALYLCVFWIYLDHQAFVISIIRRLKRPRPRAQYATVSSEEGLPVGNPAAINSTVA